MTIAVAAPEVRELNARFERATADEVLAWALEQHHPGVALVTSFGPEGLVQLDLLTRLHPQPRVITLDTGRLHQETYDLIDRVRERYGIPIEVYNPDSDRVERMVREHGANLFYRSVELRRLCCHVRKVEPLKRSLSGLAAWITGLRREQSVTRAAVQKFEVDSRHGGLLKINPLVDWTSEQVWEYLRRHNVPHNALHDRGYPSIGCQPCTRAVRPGEDERAGRWWWEEPEVKECGLHR